MNVLVAEDEPVLQFLITRLMAGWGFKLDLAADGLEAVTLAQRNVYDLCIMDIEMPRMGGITAMSVIRDTVAYIPILAFTANAGYKQECLKAGADAFLIKPSSPATLLSKIRQLTLKFSVARVNDNDFTLRQETPMTPEQLRELRDLEKQGLALLVIENGSQRFVVHKNVQNKMSAALIGEGKELFEFLDRGENPANCHLYKSGMQVNRLLLTPEQFEKRKKLEDADIESYTTPVDAGFKRDE